MFYRWFRLQFPVIYLGETRVAEDKRKALYEAFAFLEAFLAAGDWVAGTAEPSLADLFVAASVSSIVYVGADLSAYPRIAAWYERCKRLKGWAENEAGAKAFAERVTSKLTEKF